MLNDYYFEKIDSEEKAYFIGLLLADGCITKHHGVYRQIQLHLAIKDLEIVEKLKSITESTRKLYISPDRTRCMFRESSDIMVEHLSRFGIVPCKTGNEKPNFDSIPRELIRHTIRGLIDGDGWLSISNTYTGRVVTSIGICGSYYVCDYVTRLLNEEIGVSILTPSKVKDKDCYKIGYASLSDAKIIIEYLYSGATIGLSRKFERAKIIYQM